MERQISPAVKVAQVRPGHLLKQQAELLAADIAWLASQKDNFVETTCPACSSQSAKSCFAKHQLTYRRCAECGTVFVSPRPTAAILEQYYIRSQHYAFWNQYIWPQTAAVRREKVALPRLIRVFELAGQFLLSSKRMLEVGAGFGFFCEAALHSGRFAQIIALEPNPALAETCRQKGLEVMETVFEKADLADNSVDILAAFEVIEHVFDPGALLRKCERILNHNGLLIMTCPNVNGFEIAVLQEKADSVEQEHMNLFTPDSLKRLLAASGFALVELTTPGRLDAEIVRNKVFTHEYDAAANCFLKQILIDRWEELGQPFQSFLAEHGLSSHMWVVARKP